MHTHSPQPEPRDCIDAEYRFGWPKVYLTAHEQARLILLRSRLGDTHAERLARAAGRPVTSDGAAAGRVSLR